MTGNQLLELLTVGIVAGTFGQGLRVIVGLKKASDEAAAGGSTLRNEGLDVSRLILSLFIGAIAGGIGIFTVTGFSASSLTNITAEMFFGVVGIGYAGTDFIEGFVRTQLPKVTTLPRASVLSTSSINLSEGDFSALTSTADRIKLSCARLLQIPANAGDCSGFAKAVAKEFSVKLTGQANEIVDQLTAANGWTELGSDDQAGKRAAAAAARGDLVIGARKESGNGHVVVVVGGAPLAHGKYPFAYWGKLNDPANAGFNKTVNWAWNQDSRDSVTYASQSVA